MAVKSSTEVLASWKLLKTYLRGLSHEMRRRSIVPIENALAWVSAKVAFAKLFLGDRNRVLTMCLLESTKG
jgi:hypothetical protein